MLRRNAGYIFSAVVYGISTTSSRLWPKKLPLLARTPITRNRRPSSNRLLPTSPSSTSNFRRISRPTTHTCCDRSTSTTANGRPTSTGKLRTVWYDGRHPFDVHRDLVAAVTQLDVPAAESAVTHAAAPSTAIRWRESPSRPTRHVPATCPLRPPVAAARRTRRWFPVLPGNWRRTRVNPCTTLTTVIVAVTAITIARIVSSERILCVTSCSSALKALEKKDHGTASSPARGTGSPPDLLCAAPRPSDSTWPSLSRTMRRQR